MAYILLITYTSLMVNVPSLIPASVRLQSSLTEPRYPTAFPVLGCYLRRPSSLFQDLTPSRDWQTYRWCNEASDTYGRNEPNKKPLKWEPCVMEGA